MRGTETICGDSVVVPMLTTWALQNYGHNSVVSFSSGEQYVGKDEIRAFFATLTAPGALLAPETYELEVRTASTI